jgi:hypothetical protein
LRDQLIAKPDENAPPDRGAFFFGRAAWVLAACALGAFVWRLYLGPFDSATGFDDEANLDGLASVADADSALRFVLTGGAGPLGRPLALMSFLLDATAWPSEPERLLRTNVLVHLLNVALVGWFALRLADVLPRRPARPAWFALGVAALWGCSPLLMSASLLTVQRMTTLSASFALAGALGWLVARRALAQRPGHALAGMSLALAVGTLLASLCKETGALLPLLVAVLELTLVGQAWPGPPGRGALRLWRCWKAIAFGVPAVLLLIYGYLHLRDPEALFQGRGYGVQERLLTEARILFTYLRYLLVPQRAGLGPFQDDYPVSSGLLEPPTTLVALLGWAALAALAWRLRRGPGRLLGFALAWFLVGHSLESSVFPLEPYFEHRNYLPSVGVFVGACAGLLAIERLRRGAGLALFAILAANIAFTARELSAVWGQPLLAGELWSREHPASFRALMNFSRAVGVRGDIERSVAIFDAAPPQLRRQPVYVAARLQLYCGLQPPDRVAGAAAALPAIGAGGIVDYPVPQSIGIAMDLAALGLCRGFDPAAGRAALEAILALPGERVMPRALPVTHEILARYWTRERRFDATLHHLEQEYALGGSADAVARIVAVLGSASLCPEAARRLAEAEARRTWNPLADRGWRLRLQGARDAFASACAQGAS